MSAISATDINDNNNATLQVDSSSVPAVVSDDSNVLENSNDEILQSSDSDEDVLGTSSYFVKFDCPTSVDEGQAFDIDFEIYDGGYEAGGTITLNVDGTDIKQVNIQETTGTFSSVLLDSGTHSVYAKYPGNGPVDPCVSETVQVTVGGVTPSKISVWFEQYGNVPSSMDEGDDVSVSVIVYSDYRYSTPMTEPVSFRLTAGSNKLNASSDSSGIATFSLKNLPAGSYSVIIAVDDDNYESQDTLQFNLVVNGGDVQEGSFAELASLIAGSSTISLDKDYKYVSGESTKYFEYSSEKTIIGNGHTIDASALSGGYLFFAQGSPKLTLKDVTITGGTFSSPALYIAAVEMDNVSIIGVTSTATSGYYQGIVAANAVDNIKNSYFINNTASRIISSQCGWMNDKIQNNVFLNNTISGYVCYSDDYCAFNNNVLINSKNDFHLGDGSSSGTYKGTDGLTINGPDEFTNSANYTFALSNSNLPEFELLVDINSEYADVTPTVVTLGGGKTATVTVNAKKSGAATLKVGSDLVCNPIGTKEITVNTGKPHVALGDFSSTDVTITVGDSGSFYVNVYDNLVDYTAIEGVNVSLTAGDTVVYAVSDAMGGAHFDLSTIPVGVYNNTVVTVDDDNYESDSYTISLTVNEKPKTPVTIELYQREVEITEGESGNFSVYVYDGYDQIVAQQNVRVSLTAGDTVVYAVSDDGGEVLFNLSTIPAGVYNNTVIVVDDDKYESDPRTISLTVNEKPKTIVVLGDYPDSIEIYQDTAGDFYVYVYDNITDKNPIEGARVNLNANGTVISAVSDAQGKAAFDLSTAPVGEYSAVVVVNDLNYKSDAISVPMLVKEDSRSTVIINNFYGITKIVMIEGQSPGCAFLVTTTGGYALGGVNVKLSAGTNELNNITDEEGNIYFDLKTIPVGEYTAVVVVDDNLYKSDSVLFSLIVNSKKESILTVDRFDEGKLEINLGDHVLLNATLKDFDNNNPISDATIVFLLNETEYTNVTDAEGNAHFDLSEIAAGNYVVNYKFDGNSVYSGDATFVNDNLIVSKISTEITVANATFSLNIDDEVDAGASLTPADAGALVYTSSNETVAVVVDGKIKALAGGNAVITVSFDGDDTYAAADSKIIDVTVLIPTEITVANATFSLNVNDEVDSGASLTPADAGNLTYTSSDETVAVVVDGKIKALAEGSAVITVSFDGNEEYAAASENKTIEVTVTLNDASVSVENDTLDLFVDDTYTIVPVTVPENLNVNYLVDNSGVVSVDENGVVTALSEGNATIIVAVGDGKVYAYNSTAVGVTVSKIPTEIIIENATLDMKVNDVADPVVSIMPSNAGNLSFMVSDSDVILVNGSGVITAVGEGTATVTVSFMGNDKYTASNATIAVTVTLNDASVSVENDTLDLKVNDTYAIVPITAPEGLNVTYTSSNESVATVDADGIVTAVGLGKAVITLTVGGDGVYALNSTTVNIIVKKDLNLNASSMTMGQNVTIIITGFENATGNATITIGEDNYTTSIMWGMSFLSVPKLDKNVTAYIYYPGDDNYNSASTTVDIIAKIDLNLTASADPIYVGQNATLIVTGFENATGNVTVIAGRGFYNTTIMNGTATFSISGLNNTTTAYIIYIGDNNHNMAYTNVTITVNPKENATIIIDAPEITVGENATVTVTLPEDATGTVSIGNEIVDVINGAATVILTNLPAGNNTLPVIYSGDVKYNPIETDVTVTVNKVTTEITVQNATIDMKVNDVVDPVVSLMPSDAGNLSFMVSDENVILVNGSGVITAVGEGTATVTVSFNGNDKYAASNATITVTVSLNDASVSVENDTLELDVYDEFTITPTTTPEGLNVTYTSSDESVVTVDADGKVTAVGGGDATITVSVGGDGVYAENSTEIAVTVNKLETILTVDNVRTVYNTTCFVVATLTDVNGNILSGVKVKIAVGDLTQVAKTDENGQVSLDISTLEAGEYTIGARSSGIDGIYSESKVYAKAIVYPEKLDTTLTVPDVYVIGNSSGVVVATLKDSEGKALSGINVKIVVGDLTQVAKTDENGQVSLDISGLAPGEYKISARSSGVNKLYKEAKTTAKAIVSQEKLDATLTVPDVYVIGDSSGVVVATLTDSDGKAISGVNVKIVVGDLTITAKTDENGQVSLDISGLAPGEYKISARSSGVNYIYKEAKATAKAIVSEEKLDATLTVPDVIAVGNSSAVVVATLKDSYDNLIGGVNVKIVVGDLSVVAKTDENGQVSLDISDLAPGQYKISARSSGVSEIYKEAKTSAKAIISEEKIDTTLTIPDVTVDGSSSALVVATLKDSYKNLVSGVNVKIVVGDLSKTAKTDENGQVSLDISGLAPGEYKISARSSAVSDLYAEAKTTAKAIVNAN
jgi:uncharacterized protein YjdB